jgi:hypothetical protein
MHFLSLFGLIAVTAGLIFYAMETFSPCIRHRVRDGRALRISPRRVALRGHRGLLDDRRAVSLAVAKGIADCELIQHLKKAAGRLAGPSSAPYNSHCPAQWRASCEF